MADCPGPGLTFQYRYQRHTMGDINLFVQTAILTGKIAERVSLVQVWDMA